MLTYLITSIFDFTLGFLAARKTKNRASLAAACCLGCLGFWSLELFLLSYISDVNILYPLFYITRWGLFLVPFSFAFFVYRILSKRSKPFIYWALVPGAISCLLLCIANITILPSTLEPTPGGFLPKIDVTAYWHMLNFSYLSIIAIAYCALSYSNISFRERQKVRWITTTSCILLPMGWLTFSLLESQYLSKSVGAILNILFSIVLYYTLDGSYLMNISRAITEGLSRLLVITVFVVLYFSLDVYNTNTTNGAFIIFMFVLLTSQTYPYALKTTLRCLRKIFFQNEKNYAKSKIITLNHFENCNDVRDLIRATDNLIDKEAQLDGYTILLLTDYMAKELPEFCSKMPKVKIVDEHHAIVEHMLGAPHLTLRDEVPKKVSNTLNSLGAEAFFPIIHEKKIIGVFTIGKPLTEKDYTYEDTSLIHWLEKHIGRVLHRIIMLEAMQYELSQSRKTLSLVSMMNQYNHDIKAPLAVIDGVLSTDLYDSEKQREIIMSQVERGTRLITTMASILRGKRSRKLTPVLLDDILLDCLLVFEKRFNNTKTKLSKPPAVVADTADLKIMFINVIKNAAESYQKGRALDLSISTKYDETLTTVSISDTGTGMNEAQLKYLWSESSSSKKDGNGIGLQAIKRIADEHDIKISAESQLGKGTTFHFYFKNESATPKHPSKIDSLDF